MDELAKATIVAIREKIPNLGTAKLGEEYWYHSLPLCVIDAVFSIGVRYRNVQNVVQSWCVAQRPNWQKYGRVAQARVTIADLIRVTNGYEGDALAQKFFGGNRQRTSSRSGILKADAVVRVAKALQESGVEDFPDIRVPPALSALRKPSAPSPGKEVVSRSIISGCSPETTAT